MADTVLSPTYRGPVAFDERTRKVLELKQQIAAGTYAPDPRQVAAAMLNEWVQTARRLPPQPASPPDPHTAEGRRAAAGRFLVSTRPAAVVAGEQLIGATA